MHQLLKEDFGFDTTYLRAGTYFNTAMKKILSTDGLENINSQYKEAVAMTNVNETIDYKTANKERTDALQLSNFFI